MNIQKITLPKPSPAINSSKSKAQNEMSLLSEVQLDSVSLQGMEVL